MEQESSRRDIERVPPSDRESGFHGRYFIVPKKYFRSAALE